MRRRDGQPVLATERPRKSPQLSGSTPELLPKGHVNPEIVGWWRLHAGALPGPDGDLAQPILVGPSGSGFAWIKWGESQTHEPHVAVYTDPGADAAHESLYDPRHAYETARRRGTPRISAHGAFRDLDHGDHAAAIGFLQRFGPLLIAPPATLGADDLWPGPGLGLPDHAPLHGWWVNLADFWRRHRCYVAVLRVWEAFHDPMHKDLRSALQEVVRLRPDFAALQLGVDDALEVGLALATAPAIDDLGIAPKPHPSEIADVQVPDAATSVESAAGSALQRVALRIVGECLDAAGRGVHVSWRPERKSLRGSDDAQMRTGNAIARRGVATFTMQLRAGSLWGFLWLFFGLDTGDGIGWRVCPNDGRVFYPPRRDRYYCSADEQRRATKRESEQRQRRAARRK